MSKSDNSPYLTITKLYGQIQVAKMEWDSRAGDYIVAQSKPFDNQGRAEQFRDEWAQSEGLEVRG
jgi:hypothetical protein